MQLTPNLIVSLVGILISLAFSYFPKLNTGFASLSTEAKSGIMLGLMALVSGGMFGLGCVGLIVTGVVCNGAGAWIVVQYFIIAVVSNQGAYLISPQTKSVKQAKVPVDPAQDWVNRINPEQ